MSGRRPATEPGDGRGRSRSPLIYLHHWESLGTRAASGLEPNTVQSVLPGRLLPTQSDQGVLDPEIALFFREPETGLGLVFRVQIAIPSRARPWPPFLEIWKSD